MSWRTILRLAAWLAAAGFLTATGGSSDCTSFGEQNCMGAANADCFTSGGQEGTCQCCWGVQSGSTFQCYGCNVAACGARGYGCGANGLCVFPPPPAGPSCSGSSPSGCPTPPNCPKGTHQQNCTCVPP